MYLSYFGFGSIHGLLVRKPTLINSFIWVLLTLLLLLTVRLKEPAWDMVSYSWYANMSGEYPWYMWREILYFFSLKSLRYFLEFEYVLLTIDIFVLLIVAHTFRRVQLPIIYFYGFFVFFIAIMGYQNAHRQFLSAILSMFLLSLLIPQYKWDSEEVLKRSVSQIVVFILILTAALFHNVALILLPILLFRYTGKFTILFCIFMPLMAYGPMTLLAATKSSQSSGVNWSFVFLLYLLICFQVILLQDRQKNSKFRAQVKGLFIYFTLICILSMLVLSVAAQERVLHFLLISFFPMICSAYELRFKQKRLLSLLHYFCLFLPIYFVDVSKFLYT